MKCLKLLLIKQTLIQTEPKTLNKVTRAVCLPAVQLTYQLYWYESVGSLISTIYFHLNLKGIERQAMPM